jgi:hypothetical protein
LRFGANAQVVKYLHAQKAMICFKNEADAKKIRLEVETGGIPSSGAGAELCPEYQTNLTSNP